METGVLIALVGVLGTLAGILVQALVGPIVAPWYAERVQRVQHRFQRGAEQRRMVENELDRGFEILAAVRNFKAALDFLPSEAATQLLIQELTQVEATFGPWRPRKIEDTNLRDLCEDFRSVTRNFRLATQLRPAPYTVPDRADEVELEMNQRADQITAAMNKLRL